MAALPLPNPLVCHGHTRPIVDLQYSPITSDGYFIASASKDGQPMIRNGETGDWIGTFIGHKGAVWACVLNKPALLAATASADYSARLWNAETGDEVHRFEHPSVVRTCGFSAAGDRLITGGMDKKLRCFDVARPDAEPAVVGEPSDRIRCAVWAQDDKTILVSHTDKPAFDLWDVRTQSVVRSVEAGGPVMSIEVSEDGRFITTADGKDVVVWDGASVAERKRLPTDYGVESASYCAAAGKLAAGGADMWVHLYDAESYEELHVNKGHHGPVHCVRFSPTHDTYASGSEDGTIRIWQVSPKQE